LCRRTCPAPRRAGLFTQPAANPIPLPSRQREAAHIPAAPSLWSRSGSQAGLGGLAWPMRMPPAEKSPASEMEAGRRSRRSQGRMRRTGRLQKRRSRQIDLPQAKRLSEPHKMQSKSVVIGVGALGMTLLAERLSHERSGRRKMLPRLLGCALMLFVGAPAAQAAWQGSGTAYPPPPVPHCGDVADSSAGS
jgi:hypothetical protein